MRAGSSPAWTTENIKTMPKRKHVKKHKVIPCTDANQHIVERNERIRRQENYAIKKAAEMEAKRIALMQQMQEAKARMFSAKSEEKTE